LIYLKNLIYISGFPKIQINFPKVNKFSQLTLSQLSNFILIQIAPRKFECLTLQFILRSIFFLGFGRTGFAVFGRWAFQGVLWGLDVD
jgi:hypothetical protein